MIIRMTVNVPSAIPGSKTTVSITFNLKSTKGTIILELLGPSIPSLV